MNLRALFSIALRGSIFLAIVLFIGFAVVSTFLSGVQSGNWILILLSSAVAVFGLLWLIDKRFRNRFPFLTTWPSRSMNDRTRHQMRLLFSKNTSSGVAQTGRQVAVTTLWLYSPFIFILALAGFSSLFRPVSDILISLLGHALALSSLTVAHNFMTYKLNRRQSLSNILLTVGIYAPIAMALMSVGLLWDSLTDDDPFRISRSLVLFICYLSVFFMAVVALVHSYRLRKATVAAPDFTAHPFYTQIELSVSIASVVAIAVILLISS